MRADIETLRDTFKIGYESFEDSRKEAMTVLDLYHNRQYTDRQKQTLADRGQPAETFNVIKLFGRLLLGYYSTVVNTTKVLPVNEDDVITAAILNDLVAYVFRDNNFQDEGDKLKADLVLTGMMCSYVDVQEREGKTDQFGRPKYDIKVSHVPALEIILDPMSRLDDYSDARYIHRFKWMSEDDIISKFGKDHLKELEAYYNDLDADDAEFEYTYNERFTGKYKVWDNYLVVHSIIVDDDGKTWSIFWSNMHELSKEEITYKGVKNPYRIHKLHTSNRTEYYGIFREVIETQHAINQALLKIQLMANTQKAFVETSAIENIADFTDQFNRVNAVIPVKALSGIKIENLTREVADQYTIIDKALNRIQRVLSINDSFLGMAYASDSGTKVKLQQNASVVALRYVTMKVEQFYRLLGWDIMKLIQQYYIAHDVIRIADTYEGQKWIEINKPVEVPTGQLNSDGTPATRHVYEEIKDPASNEPKVDEDGNIMMAPIPTAESEIAFTNADVTVDTVAYNDEDEKNTLMFDTLLNGPVGQMLSQTNPTGYFTIAGLSARNTKTKYSPEIASILEQTAKSLSPEAQQAMQQGNVDGQTSQQFSANQMGGRAQTGAENG